MKLLLHACCGPCSLEPTRIFKEAGAEITLAYVNPNIHPKAEYEKRLDTLCQWAVPEGFQIIEGGYDPKEWERVVGQYGTDREKRCRACYRMRFSAVAALAKMQGFDAISSTLSVSPYQFTDVIREELEHAAAAQGVKAVFKDFRENYPEATRRSRELGMYRQNYCGCHYSIDEAASDREQRAADRRAAKAAKLAARAAAAAASAGAGTGVPSGSARSTGGASDMSGEVR